MKLGIAAALAIATTLTAAQPTFRTSTTLVEFTLVALDEDGRPVTDLKQEDIGVFEGGEPRDIAFFRFNGAVEPRATESLGSGVFTNRSEYSDGPARNVTAIVIDGIYTAPAQQQLVRTQVLRYLDSIPADTRVALYHSAYRLTILHDYTADLAELRARISALLSTPPVYVTSFDLDETEASAEPPNLRATAISEMKRLDEQYQETVEDRKRRIALASLEVVGNHLAGVPGRKSLVWITVGFPIHSTFERYLTIHDAQARRMAERLANLGVSIYPVDAQGLLPPPLLLDAPARPGRGGRTTLPPPPPRVPTGQAEQRNWATMDLLAGVTGGRVVKNTNDVTRGFKAAEVDRQGSYAVAFYAPPLTNETVVTWKRFAVRSLRRGVHALTSPGIPGGAGPAQSVGRLVEGTVAVGHRQSGRVNRDQRRRPHGCVGRRSRGNPWAAAAAQSRSTPVPRRRRHANGRRGGGDRGEIRQGRLRLSTAHVELLVPHRSAARGRGAALHGSVAAAARDHHHPGDRTRSLVGTVRLA